MREPCIKNNMNWSSLNEQSPVSTTSDLGAPPEPIAVLATWTPSLPPLSADSADTFPARRSRLLHNHPRRPSQYITPPEVRVVAMGALRHQRFHACSPSNFSAFKPNWTCRKFPAHPCSAANTQPCTRLRRIKKPTTETKLRHPHLGKAFHDTAESLGFHHPMEQNLRVGTASQVSHAKACAFMRNARTDIQPNMVEYTLNYISNCRTVNFPSKQTFHSYPRNQRSGSPCRCSKCRKSLDPSLAVSNNCNQSLSETHRTAGPPLCRIVHLSAQPWQWKHPSCAILPPSPVRPRETCASIDPQLRR